MYSERKLKIKGLLRLFSTSKGVLTVSDFIDSFSNIKTNKQDSSFIEYFPYCHYRYRNQRLDLWQREQSLV